jgi:5-methyltetrahydropteroyltriglutamate--homocysteine methyltransferase
VRVGNLIGRDRLMAGTDCGFDTFSKFSQVDPNVAWYKLEAMVDGAELTTRELS